MNLNKQIFVYLIVPLLLACLSMMITTFVSLKKNIPDWTEEIAIAVRDEELETFAIRTSQLARVSETLFQQFENDLETMSNYADNLMSGKINMTGPVCASYTGAYCNIGNRYDHTGIVNLWNNGVKSIYQDQSEALEYLWLDFRQSNPRYLSLYMGFLDGFWRASPYEDAYDKYNEKKLICLTNNNPITGYDPRCRGWYIELL